MWQPPRADRHHPWSTAYTLWNGGTAGGFGAGEGDRIPGTVKFARRHWDAFVAHSKLVMLADVRRSHVLAWRDSLVDQREHWPKSINQRV